MLAIKPVGTVLVSTTISTAFAVYVSLDFTNCTVSTAGVAGSTSNSTVTVVFE